VNMVSESLGFDLTRVARFNLFATYSSRALKRIFSYNEIIYCIASPQHSAQRFAVRFAAKEAFYKSLCCLYPGSEFSFFAVCQAFSLGRAPFYGAVVDWEKLGIAPCIVLVSVSHETEMAGAVVFLRSV